MNPYEVLGVREGASFEEIRCSYKKLAKAFHPDRLHNVDEDDKKQREEYFKKVTVAYHILLENAEKDDTANGRAPTYNWSSLKEVIMNTFVDVATKYIQRKEHTIKVPITLEEYYVKKIKKLQLFLKGVAKPVILEITCDRLNINTDVVTDDNEIHNICMELKLKDHPIFTMNDDDAFIATVPVTWKEYLIGKELNCKFLDGTDVCITIAPFTAPDQLMLHSSGKFYVESKIACPQDEWWSSKSHEEREQIIKLVG